MAELDRHLEARLAELGRHVAYPPTPDLRGPFRARLGRRPAARPRWTWLAAAAVALVAVLAAMLAIPPTRDTVAGWLGLRNVNVQRLQRPPTPSTLPGGPVGQRLGLGRPETVAEAQRLAGFAVAVPASLGAPDEVFFAPATGAVTLVYYPRRGLPEARETGVGALVTEIKGRVEGPILNKALGPGTQLQQTDVGGTTAYWLSGDPHAVFFTDAQGAFKEDALRLATNTLLWQRGQLTLRLEAPIALDGARAIARSLS